MGADLMAPSLSRRSARRWRGRATDSCRRTEKNSVGEAIKEGSKLATIVKMDTMSALY